MLRLETCIMFNSNDDQPHFVTLQKVAKEVGVDPQTITRHPGDFPRTVRMGGQRYIARVAYQNWLHRRLSEAAGEPAR